MKAWIQSTSLYLQINGWPPNQLQPDWPTLRSSKPSQRHCSKLHAECYISLMIHPRSPNSVSLSVLFFSLSRSLSLLFFLFLLLLSLPQTLYFLPVSVRERQPVLGVKAKNIKEQYFWGSRRWILPFSNATIIASSRKMLLKVWKQEW